MYTQTCPNQYSLAMRLLTLFTEGWHLVTPCCSLLSQARLHCITHFIPEPEKNDSCSFCDLTNNST